MFAGYNKNNHKGALIGNWVEEEALRHTTGYSRRKVPASGLPADRKDAHDEDTYHRVIGHTNGISDNNFQVETATVDTHRPSIAQLREAQLYEEAKRIRRESLERKKKEEAQSSIVTTENRDSFRNFDPKVLNSIKRMTIGDRRPEIVDPALAQITRGEVKNRDQQTIQDLRDTPITRYSHSIATGKGLDFPSTVSDGPNPFSRSSAFTNEIRDPDKTHAESTEPASMFDNHPEMNCHQRSALFRLQKLLKQDANKTKTLLNELKLHLDRDAIQKKHFIQTLIGILGQDGLSEKDAVFIFMYFDTSNADVANIDGLLDYCKSCSAE